MHVAGLDRRRVARVQVVDGEPLPFFPKLKPVFREQVVELPPSQLVVLERGQERLARLTARIAEQAFLIGVPLHVGRRRRPLAFGAWVFARPVDYGLTVALEHGIWAFVVLPSVPEFELAHCTIELEIVALGIDPRESVRVDAVHGDVQMRVVRVSMYGEHVLVIGHADGR